MTRTKIVSNEMLHHTIPMAMMMPCQRSFGLNTFLSLGMQYLIQLFTRITKAPFFWKRMRRHQAVNAIVRSISATLFSPIGLQQERSLCIVVTLQVYTTILFIFLTYTAIPWNHKVTPLVYPTSPFELDAPLNNSSIFDAPLNHSSILLQATTPTASSTLLVLCGD